MLRVNIENCNRSRKKYNTFINVLLVLITFFPVLSQADDINVAVASNFSITAKSIGADFKKETGHKVTFSFGSTGKQYAQIIHGAPFDVFLAADAARPMLLEEKGFASERFTYALGQLVIWRPEYPLDTDDLDSVNVDGAKHIAIANPRFAPYGRAAQQVLESQGRWDTIQSRLVRGENISQAYQFVASGNAQLGFVALSQAKHRIEPAFYRVIPPELYEPIEQQAVLLNDRSVAKEFLQFMQSEKVRQLIQQSGYQVPSVH